MEESSEAHMETDVSSTTDDVLETQEVTGSHRDVEMVVVVEEVKEEDDSSIDLKHGSNVGSVSTSSETTPQKEAPHQKNISLPPVQENMVSKKLFMSPINSESQKVANITPQASVTVKTSPAKEQLVSSDSSTSVEAKLSPVQSTEKIIDTNPIKNSQVQKVVHKSPFKDMKLVSKSPIKLNRTHKPLKEISMQETSTKIIQEQPDKEVKFKRNVNKEVKATNLQETVKEQVALKESSLNKEANIQDNQNEKVLIVEHSPIKETNTKKSLNEEVIQIETSPIKETKTQESATDELKSPEKSSSKETISTIPRTEVMEVESSNKEDNINNKSTTEAKFPDSTPITVIKDTPASSSSSVNSNVTSQDTSIDNEADKAVNGINKTVNGDENMDISVLPTDETLDTDMLNESQISDISEKEHSKSISRELKSLIKSAKDSKIISECTRLTSKSRRKSKSQLDVSNTSLNASQDSEKIGGNRRGSTNSQVSNSSEKSDRTSLKRSMRSQNPEFVSKCKLFLNSVNSKGAKELDNAMSEDEFIANPKARSDGDPDHNSSTPTNAKKKKVSEQPGPMDNGKVGKLRCDAYCWRCHWTVEQEENDKAHPPMQCTVCPRSYHYKCLSANERKTPPEKNWVCPDCLQILHAESSDTRSAAMKKTSLGMLCDLLKFALERMMDLNGVEPFMHPVDRNKFPDYDKYVIHPMDLTQMKKNIADGLYGSTEAFAADAQWILHNSIIFNTCEQAFLQSKLTGGARALVRSCRAEMGEIEACPECYAAAHARKPTWFTDVCTTPHILLWAKLKGFPYWPAKGMTVNSSGLVDVRFFGAHDRAWVPAKDCFLFSEKDPNNFRNKRQDILDSMQEAEQHIRNISRKYGKFVYPPFKTQFDPSKLTEQIKLMIPSFEGELKVQLKDKPASASPFASKMKRRSSKGSKSSANDGDVSESDETSTSARTEVIKLKESSNERLVEADSPVILNVSTPQVIETITTRKRRRSNLEEAVMTVIETSVPEKKKKLESPESKKADSTVKRKSEQQQPSSSKEEKAQLIKMSDKNIDTKSTKKADTPKSKPKDDEPSSSTVEKESLRVTPIKLVALPGQNKLTPKLFTATKVPSKPSTPNSRDKTPDGKTPQRQKSTRSDTTSTNEKAKEDKTPQSKTPQRRKSISHKSSTTEKPKEDKTKQRRQSSRSDKSSSSEKAKEDKSKSEKRSNSRNKSLNTTSTPKEAKTSEKKSDSDSSSSKELRPRDKKKDSKEAESESNKSTTPSLSKPTAAKSSKERIKYDDDTALAVIARQRHQNCDGLPTISNVCSLSTSSQVAKTTITPTTSTANCIEITIEANSNSSIFTPTSTDSVRNMKDAVTKLQKLRDNTEPVVGRVGVRAFARMTSPGRSEKSVEVEIKSEPIDLDEADETRLNEKMDLMNACKLQPVNASNLRDVRINRVVAGPTFTVNKGKVEARPRAKKTFPQPRRADDNRSELNAKNSMVYIPIRPPPTQPPPPLRQRTVTGPRPGAPISGTSLNTVISPSKPSMVTISSPTCVSAMVTTAGQVTMPTVVTVGQVPTAVHTVPLMTSVNGQWMFSLQPVMSVGVGDGSTNTPIVNGLPDRGTTPTVVPLAATATSTPTATTATTTATRANDNNSTPTELPRLQRPAIHNPFDGPPAGATVPVPSSAGPLAAKLNQSAGKLADYFRLLLEDCLDKLDAPGATAAARLQLESSRWRHSLEMEELKHNHELTLAEMRLAFEKDKLRVISETKRAAQLELDAAVKLAKSKQWCANCNQEAQLYCCWNTSYCDYPCQRLHWPLHFANCAQRPQDGNEGEVNPLEPRLQKQPDNLPKSAPPTLTVGGKIATTRVYQPDNAQKASIIVSMVEDNSGNQTMKCVGTYKPNQAQMPPLLLNKQVLNDETAKKVVTSGGYLIVGSSGSAASVIAPAPSRRSHAIQYFT